MVKTLPLERSLVSEGYNSKEARMKSPMVTVKEKEKEIAMEMGMVTSR